MYAIDNTHARTHARTYTHMHTYTHTHARTHAHARTHTHLHFSFMQLLRNSFILYDRFYHK